MALTTLLFFAAIGLVLFLPGTALLSFLERKSPFATPLERAVLIPSLSIVLVDFFMLSFDLLGIPQKYWTILLAIGIFSLGSFSLARVKKTSDESSIHHEEEPERSVSKTFIAVFILLLVLKTFYFFPNILSNTTDLGHHLYWAKKIALDHRLPVYEKQDIVVDERGNYSISNPEPISDFIIGEHLTLAAIQMISGVDFDSAFSSIILFIVHILSLFALSLLARRLFEPLPSSEMLSTLTLLLGGVFYGLGVPQMKYVVGGVVGNTYANLLIPVLFLCLIMAFRTKRTALFSLVVILLFGLAYTHHLSMFVTVIILLVAIGIRLVLSPKTMWGVVMKPFLTPWPMILFGIGTLFFFVLWKPAYIANTAVNTVVGTPEKTEHLGFTTTQLLYAVGEPRLVLGFFGLVFLFVWWYRKRTFDVNAVALLLGWTLPLVLLVLFPDVVSVDLPSGRVANYLIAPLCILSAFLITVAVHVFRQKHILPASFLFATTTLFLAILFFNGYLDNDSVFRQSPLQSEKTRALRNAAHYLADDIPRDGIVLHDHINIPGDSWIKLDFMRDYNYPFYRAYLFRYDRASDRTEKCTLYVISSPHSDEAKKCISDLHIRAVLVNQTIDGAQFEHFKDFEKVYTDPFYAIYTYDK